MTIGCSVFPPALRARIDGAVVRLPGTGDGVARLVEVSMVKVDMARALAAERLRGQSAAADSRRLWISGTMRLATSGVAGDDLLSSLFHGPLQRPHRSFP